MSCGRQDTDLKNYSKQLNCDLTPERVCHSKARPPDCQRSNQSTFTQRLVRPIVLPRSLLLVRVRQLSLLGGRHGNRCCRLPSTLTSNFFQSSFRLFDVEPDSSSKANWLLGDLRLTGINQRGMRKIWTEPRSCKGFSGNNSKHLFRSAQSASIGRGFVICFSYDFQGISQFSNAQSPTIKTFKIDSLHAGLVSPFLLPQVPKSYDRTSEQASRHRFVANASRRNSTSRNSPLDRPEPTANPDRYPTQRKLSRPGAYSRSTRNRLRRNHVDRATPQRILRFPSSRCVPVDPNSLGPRKPKTIPLQPRTPLPQAIPLSSQRDPARPRKTWPRKSGFQSN